MGDHEQPRRRSARPLIDDVTSALVLIAVVETQSITQAARRLGISPSAVSKKLSDLEVQAGARLLNRTTRRVAVTDLGVRLYERCLRIADEVEGAEEDIRGDTREPSGRLRVTAPPVLGNRHIAPAITGFLELFPRIRLELMLEATTLDMVQRGIDLSLRIARDANSVYGARPLAPIRRVFCAAPSYLARHGTPATPAELAEHNCLIAAVHEALDSWGYTQGGEARTVHVRGNLSTTSAEAIRQALIDGAGIGYLGTFVVGEDLRAGRLVEILHGHALLDSHLYAVVPHRQFVPTKVRVFIDHVAEHLGTPPYWDR